MMLKHVFNWSSRPPEAASPAGTGEPPGGPDPAAPHDRRSRLERTPRSRRRSRLARQIAAAIASSTPKSRRRSRLARPDRGGDHASRAQIAAEIAFRPPAPTALRRAPGRARAPSGASPLRFQPCRSRRRSWLRCRVPPAPAALRRAVSNRPDPVGSWLRRWALLRALQRHSAASRTPTRSRRRLLFRRLQGRPLQRLFAALSRTAQITIWIAFRPPSSLRILGFRHL
ncbi:hypothetical protein VNO78_14829 [Psophocarpus tetragonolobus]|uniref:Uncharacterized protein n=1 Tax=Psophocarpus tetragonolobus TaxID=3891 RepID=A0AAN9SIK2_PSOTE